MGEKNCKIVTKLKKTIVERCTRDASEGSTKSLLPFIVFVDDMFKHVLGLH